MLHGVAKKKRKKNSFHVNEQKMADGNSSKKGIVV